MSAAGSWTIRRRLLSAFALVSLLTVALGGVGYYAAANGASAVEEIGVVRLPSVQALLVISEAQTAVDSAENALLARNLTPQLRQEQYARFDAARTRFEQAWKVYEPLPQTAEEAVVWKKFVPAWKAWWKDHEAYVGLAKDYEANPTDAAYAALSHHALVTIGATFGEAERLLTDLVRINERAAENATREATSTAALVKVGTIASMLVAVLFATGLGLFITSRLNGLLAGRVTELRQGAEQVSSASSQVASSAQSLSQGATEQAASLEETSASMEEMASMTRSNAESAGEAARLMVEVDRQVNSSNQNLADMVAAMASIKDSSARIAKIIKTIDEIAFQTNILALNAAVEAARAGDAGMGFAVVANEVRNLAQRAATAARDTASLIDESRTSADAGAAHVGRVQESISGLTESVAKVKSIAEQVSSASRQQAQGIDQVTQAITQMEKVTQTTAATSEESAAASEELNAQAESSMEVVRQLAGLVWGSDGVETSAVAERKTTGPSGSVRRHLRVVAAPSAPAGSKPEATGTFGSF
jgi:methyl-accepting chemotaxis protein